MLKPPNVEAPTDQLSAFIPILPANIVKTENIEEKSEAAAKSSEVKKEEQKVETSAMPAVVGTKKAETSKIESTKAQSTQATDLDQNLENSLDDKEIFNDNSPGDLSEKEIDTNVDLIDPDEDEDDYPPEIARDNNKNMENKLNQIPNASVDIRENENEQPRDQVQIIGEFEENPDSNFFAYLCIVMFLSILLYILYHNRHKLLALLLEGRRGSRRQRERSRGGSKAAYSKLDCNLEEAITSKKSLSGKSMDIIY